jgi:prophage antirepressor-like protein
MSSILSVFDFKNNPVRVIIIDEIPWFVVMDVATVLDYTDPSMMVKHVDKEDKQVVNPQKLDNVKMTESFGSNTFKVSVINESGLYAAIFGSTKKEAKEFKKWVTSEVLPSIRKTGSYSLVESQQEFNLPKTYLEALKALVASEEQKLILEEQIKKDAPLVDYAKAVQFSDDAIDFGAYAKMIGTGRTRLFRMMRDAGVIMKNSTLPYQQYVDAGYFEVSQEIDTENGRLIPFALVTGKGQIWLKQRLEKLRQTEKAMAMAITQGVLF